MTPSSFVLYQKILIEKIFFFIENNQDFIFLLYGVTFICLIYTMEQHFLYLLVYDSTHGFDGVGIGE